MHHDHAVKTMTMTKRLYEKEKRIERLLEEKADLTAAGVLNESSFHVGSFIGGMVLIILLNVIIIFGIRFYNARGNRSYNYLLWGESNT